MAVLDHNSFSALSYVLSGSKEKDNATSGSGSGSEETSRSGSGSGEGSSGSGSASGKIYPGLEVDSESGEDGEPVRPSSNKTVDVKVAEGSGEGMLLKYH